MAPLTLTETTIALSAQVNGGEPFEFGTVTLPVTLTFDRDTGVASLATTPVGEQLAAAFRRFADQLELPESVELPVPEGTEVIRCTQCDAAVAGDPRFASLLHEEDGAHLFEQRLTPASTES